MLLMGSEHLGRDGTAIGHRELGIRRRLGEPIAAGNIAAVRSGSTFLRGCSIGRVDSLK